MPIVVNSNASATEASFNLSRNNEALRKSLGRLSSGKRISNPADDAGGLAVAYKLNSTINRSYATIQNAQNSLSYLQVQDSSLATVGKILDRMAELRTMAQDITKNSGDIENYSKEFIELQSQLRQIKEEKFNGISLFAVHAGTAAGSKAQMTKADNGGVYVDASGASIAYNKFGRELVTHPSGNTGNGSISLNVVNLQFVLSLNGNANVNLGGIGHANSGITTTGLGSDNFITRIRDVSVSEIINAIEKLADARAENGAEQNRIMNSINLLQTNVTNLEAAHGRIMDADIALESTRFARYNVLVQASAAMTAQANQMTNIALSLLG
ncbi:MAG: flagellin [Opitutae bacterium]|nr:flagellin [Opitutae bacterium]|tara:strand:+ start:1070 stop:2050 length:981 start_codon:yes stop_codon:yes gene_type:complete